MKKGDKPITTILTETQKEENYLRMLIQDIDNLLSELPGGNLVVCCRDGHPEYYQSGCNSKGTLIRHYIPQKDITLAGKLAQKDYLLKTRKEAVRLLKQISNFNEKFDESVLTSTYSQMSPARQELVTPLILNDEEYAEQWKSIPFVTKGGFKDNWDLKSKRGECMRSKSEILIASLFDDYGIPYKYEPRLVLRENVVCHPDFLVLNKRTRKDFYWEHFGMLGHEDYTENALCKIDFYANNGLIQGVNIIYTFESDNKRALIETYKRHIEEFLL